MARYWVYLNDEVAGPYGVDQLIRLRGFSRQTLVCVDEAGGEPKSWISTAEIPELTHIFKAVDEHMAEPAVPTSKPAAKKPPRSNRPFVPAVTLRAPKRNFSQIAGWVLLAAAVIGASVGYSVGSFVVKRDSDAKGVLEEVLAPGRYPLNPYAYSLSLAPVVESDEEKDAAEGEAGPA